MAILFLYRKEIRHFVKLWYLPQATVTQMSHHRFKFNIRKDINLLAVIIDINPIIWADLGSFETALEQITLFLNAHLSLQYNNRLVVIGSGIQKSKILYPSNDLTNSTQRKPASSYKLFFDVDRIVAEGIKSMIQHDMSLDSCSSSFGNL